MRPRDGVPRRPAHHRRERCRNTPGDVVNAMVGRVIDNLYPPKQGRGTRSGEIILEVRGLTDARASATSPSQLHKGEILGLAGLIGAGRSEIVKGICGSRASPTGRVLLAGKPAGRDYATASPRASSTCPRTARATASSSTCRSPPTSRRCDSAAGRQRGGHHRRAAARPSRPSGWATAGQLKRGQHRPAGLERCRAATSRRWRSPRCSRSPQGDLPRRADARRRCRRQGRDPPHPARLARGVGIVVISSELPELIGLCDRVLVVSEGRIAGEGRRRRHDGGPTSCGLASPGATPTRGSMWRRK
jgi:ribose transport system ATP-binding protein